MNNKVYIINPKYTEPSYFGSEILQQISGEQLIWISDLVLPTIAAYIPSDIEVKLCDENLTSIDFNTKATIFITGKDNQYSRLKEIAKEFKKREQTVVIGGATATLHPELMNEYCDILVTGEFESISETFFKDLKAGFPEKKKYIGAPANLTETKTPRWDLYPVEKAVIGSIQTSRGCNYNCDFCLVSIYSKTLRTKPVNKVIEELNALYDNGFRSIFISDDNFASDLQHFKQTLKAIIKWNNRNPVAFIAQLPINIGKNKELLKLCSQAGIFMVFTGIETGNKKTLNKIHKQHNLLDIKSCITNYLKSGIILISGVMFGFEDDTPEEATELIRYFKKLPIPLYTIYGVMAVKGSKLHTNLKNKICKGQLGTSSFKSNINHKNMTDGEFQNSIHRLFTSLLNEEEFFIRTHKILKYLRVNRKLYFFKDKPITKTIDKQFFKYLKQNYKYLYDKISHYFYHRPELLTYLPITIVFYMQFVYTYKFFMGKLKK
jgi:radical SAM superfamily enzyme YgiQ (UPF0313 family)